MTYTSLASIVKYPVSSEACGKHGKFGFFATEEEYYVRIAESLGITRLSATGEPLQYARHPLVYLMEAADDICYEIMDIEDAHKLKLLTYEETEALLLGFFDKDKQADIRQRLKEEGVTDNNEKIVYLRACAVGVRRLQPQGREPDPGRDL